MEKKAKATINLDEDSQKQANILERWSQPYKILDLEIEE